jgi:uncharacterized protein (DUF305 family)
MRIAIAVLGTISLCAVSSAVLAQGAGQTSRNFPEECTTAAQASGQGVDMQKIQAQMSKSMQEGMQSMGQMTETQKGLAEAMMKMHSEMMQGMMAKDADVAWICAMIPHHQGAIDMARAGLKGADNAQSKRMAEETIKQQEKEIAKLVAWVKKNAAREEQKKTGSLRH